MTVFVVHPVDLDLSKASEWGSISYIADRHIYVDQIGDDQRLPRENKMRMQAAANRFKANDDYFLLVGDQLQLVAFAAELTFNHPIFTVLRYDKKAEGYVPVRIET